MSKTLSFRGLIPDGLQQKIRLRTLNGKTGYRITKFQTISESPGADSSELVTKIYTKDQTGSMTTTANFDESDLLALALFAGSDGSQAGNIESVIFDNEVFNQDIYIYSNDVRSASTVGTNFYLELETVALSDIQATQLTLKNLRIIASR